LETEVVQKTPVTTEAEALSFYAENKSRIPEDFNSVRQNIIDYLRERRQGELASALASRLRAGAQVKINVAQATPPVTATDLARVFAVVDGKNITSADIEENIRPLIFSTQEQIYNARKNQLDTIINDLLLETDAKKQNTTARELLKTQVEAKAPVITEEDALKFFNENKERIAGAFAEVKPSIIEYLTEEAKTKRSAAFARQLRANAAVQTFLTEPEQPVYNIAIDDQPIKGNPKAAVTLVEFTDYQCPSCARQSTVLEKLVTEFGDRIRLVVRDFPLNQHKEAWKAAEAAEAAREQGKYWEFVTLLYARQSALEVEKLKQYATELGLDRAKFDSALDRKKFSEKVQRDFLDGQRVGVDGTPSIFLNGRRITDYSYEALKAAIEAALKKTG
jgi:protein-disulfide isomerase